MSDTPDNLSPASEPPKAVAASASSTSAAEPGWERQLLERLAMGQLQEQRTARRWKIALRLLWLGFAVLVLVLVKTDFTTPQSTTRPHTAMLEISGEIAADAPSNAQAVVDSLRSAFEDPGAQAVVLLINSPGGSPVQAGIINDEIYRLKALHGKPVYAVVEETCASAAYYIASAADNIYVDKASLVGSIGVLMDGFGFTGLMNKVGIERRLLTAGENKGFMDPFSPQSEEQRKYAQSMLKEIHQQFIEVVKRGRGDRLKNSTEVFSGLVWSGQKAVEMGLADDLASLDQVAREIVQAEEIIDYTQRENVAERLAKQLGAGAGEAAMSLMGRWAPSVR